MDRRTQYEVFQRELPGASVVPCQPACAWKFENAHRFEQISVTPSLDASASGHWHGFITAGGITP